MKRALFLAYGIAAHALFLVVFLAMAAFVGNLGGPWTIDGGGGGLSWTAAVANVGLLLLFAVPHSVMARPAFKRWWTRFVPEEIERSTYVLVACVCVVALMAFWTPMGPLVWSVESSLGRGVLWGLFAFGWLMVPLVSLLINHFDLFGTRQVWLAWKRQAYAPLAFRTPGVYRLVRHPLYVGWTVAFWATPDMTVGHLLFALVLTGYMVAVIPLEERDLVDALGDEYRDYRRDVPAMVPGFKARARVAATARVEA